MKKFYYFLVIISTLAVFFMVRATVFQNLDQGISAPEAVAVALNRIEKTPQGLVAHHPKYKTTFTKAGVTFTPQKGPSLHYALASVGPDMSGQSLIFDTPAPIQQMPRTIDYNRGTFTERYVLKTQTVEQLFILQSPLNSGEQDFRISGTLQTSGQLKKRGDGWAWQDENGEVFWNKILVTDATGKTLMAKLEIADNHANIVIDGKALAQANYPVTVDPEIGTNDFRLSDMGDDGDTDYGAFNPAVTYNSTDNQYLVVWYGDDNSGSLVDGESEIWGQLVNADGTEDGTDFRLSDMGDNGSTNYDANNPAVTYNATDNQYLVVWRGDDNSGSLVDNELEIWGQLVNADGTEDGNDFRLSDMGDDGDANYDADNPAVTYNSTDNQYLVVWAGEDNSGSLVDNELEIWGQLVDANGTEDGTDFRLSDMGDDGDANYDASEPDVTYNATDNQYLVIWFSDDNSGSLVDNELEIWGQLVDADGTEDGSDFRLSDMGDDGSTNYGAAYPAVTYNATDNQYFVVWVGEDNSGILVDGESEIWGQLVDADGTEDGSDFRLSDMGDDGDANYDASLPAVTYNATDNQYFVIWFSDDNSGSLVDNELEIWGQLVDADGTEDGSDFRLSNMGDDGDANYDADNPAVTYNATDNQYFVIWFSDDNSGSLVDGEIEIWGQLYNNPICGNGIVDTDSDELCDDGDSNSNDTANACRTSCETASCGDGVVDTGEECDDGDSNSNDTANACRTSCDAASCGDGVVDTGEECDDGDSNSNDTANACRTTCETASCGDGVVDTGEECDDGDSNSNDTANACRTSCDAASCGDGVVDTDEECDDGNTFAEDGCSAACEDEDDSSSTSGGGCNLSLTPTDPSGLILSTIGLFAVFGIIWQRRKACEYHP